MSDEVNCQLPISNFQMVKLPTPNGQLPISKASGVGGLGS
jgi:hypothetical protein